MSRLSRRSLVQGALAVGAAPLLGGCPSPTWTNVVGNQRVTPFARSFPENARQLSELVAEAESHGLRIRMTGSGHSFSDVALTSDVLLGPDRLRAPLPFDSTELRPNFPAEPGRAYYRTQSGTTIRQLNQRTWQRGLSLRNLGGYNAQTVAGAAMTGTHGSGLDYGPIASQIASVQVVGAGGRLVQVEPTNGITDPCKFKGHLLEDPSVPVTLVQDDDVFHAVAISMGCMGIAYSVVLEVQRRFWLRERRTRTTWEKLKAKDGFLARLLAEGTPPARPGEPRPDHYEIYVSPYAKDGQHTALLTERFKLDKKPSRNADARQRGRAFANIGAFLAALGDQLGLVTDYLNRHPEEGPKIIETALKELEDDVYINRGYEVYNLGVANKARAIGVEPAFDITQTVAATEELFAIAERERSAGRTHTIPVSLRFVKASPIFLAPQSGRPTMMMEINMLAGVEYSESILTNYEHAFISRFSARPHWGLDLDVIHDPATIAALYPAWPKWLHVYEQLNPRGTFDADFTDRVGISRKCTGCSAPPLAAATCHGA
ncbi:MAG: FAD-binding protein [Polyangiaceae bacterium]